MMRVDDNPVCASCDNVIRESEVAYVCPIHGHEHYLCKTCNDHQEWKIDQEGCNSATVATHPKGVNIFV